MDTSILQEAYAEFWRMPLWVQAGLGLFACGVLWMLFGGAVTGRRYRRQFDGFARELGVGAPAGRGEIVSFAIQIAGRPFEVEHYHRMRSGSYRGPTGYLLVAQTALRGTRWEMHQVDIVRLGALWRWLGAGQATGADGSSVRFGVKEDGVPVRDGWLDDETREAVARFLEAAPPLGTLWIKEGRLSYLMSDPWKGLDGPVLQGTMQRLAELATALERTARGPMRA
jgi:hypothetical protein